MLEKISIRNFKSLNRIDQFKLPRLAVFFGPNAAGKSNFLDAIQALSRIGTARTLSDALQEPIRGYPIEAFSFPPGGLPELLGSPFREFGLGAVLKIDRDSFEYRVSVRIDPHSGSLSVEDEYLAVLTSSGAAKGNPLLERKDGQLRIRRKSKPAHPRQEPTGLNHSLLSDPRLSGIEYRGIERCRTELSRWRTYYLDPRVSMRRAATPADVDDIGVLGENIAPYLYRLRAEHEREFKAAVRTLRTLIPAVEDVAVDLDKRRGTLDIVVRQGGVEYSSRIVSEGTLRVLALCGIAVNPWGGSLLAFEEPENGVHPRRLELIADLLAGLALERERQILVTTHSPLFCNAIFKRQQKRPGEVGLFRVRQGPEGTEAEGFEVPGPLFADDLIRRALSEPTEEGIFQGLLLRGIIDE
jgi:predicted ATPase